MDYWNQKRKSMIAIISTYIVGYILAYLFIKVNVAENNNDWTKEDRVVGLVFAAGSWITLLLGVIMLGALHYIKDLKKPVKW
jgi:hypothetical protein